MSSLVELIEKHTREGSIDCGMCFKISRQLEIDITEVSDKVNEMGIKIAACQLGQFGKFKHEIGGSDAGTTDLLKQVMDEKRRVFCKDAREIAENESGFRKIRASLRENKIDVKYCLLGCFKEKKGKQMDIKTKIWIENSHGDLLFGRGKTEVLDMVDKAGSIKKASENLDMNYKKCWSHLKILERHFGESLFETRQGGGDQAGTRLKPRAYELMSAYRELERDIEEFADKRFKELFLKKDE